MRHRTGHDPINRQVQVTRPEVGVLVDAGLKYLNQSADSINQIFLNLYITKKASTVFGGKFERKRNV